MVSLPWCHDNENWFPQLFVNFSLARSFIVYRKDFPQITFRAIILLLIDFFQSIGEHLRSIFYNMHTIMRQKPKINLSCGFHNAEINSIRKWNLIEIFCVGKGKRSRFSNTKAGAEDILLASGKTAEPYQAHDCDEPSQYEP